MQRPRGFPPRKREEVVLRTCSTTIHLCLPETVHENNLLPVRLDSEGKSSSSVYRVSNSRSPIPNLIDPKFRVAVGDDRPTGTCTRDLTDTRSQGSDHFSLSMTDEVSQPPS